MGDALEYLIGRGLVLRQPDLLVSYYARQEQAFVHLGKLGGILVGETQHQVEIFEAMVLGVLSHAMHLKIKPPVGTNSLILQH